MFLTSKKSEKSEKKVKKHGPLLAIESCNALPTIQRHFKDCITSLAAQLN